MKLPETETVAWSVFAIFIGFALACGSASSTGPGLDSGSGFGDDSTSGNNGSGGNGGSGSCFYKNSDPDPESGFEEGSVNTASDNYVAVGTTTGSYNWCGITSSGAPKCWGSFVDSGDLNDPDEIPSGNFVDVDVSEQDACALTDGGRLKCWGLTEAFNDNIPNNSFREFVVSDAVCAVTNSGEIACWGANAPSPPSGEFSGVAVWPGNDGFSAGVKQDGSLVIETENTSGIDPSKHAPFSKKVFTESGFHCALTESGKPVCWQPEWWNQEQWNGCRFRDFTAHHAVGSGICGITEGSGEIVCANDLGAFQFRMSKSAPYKSVAGAEGAVCGVAESGQLDCWTNETEPAPP